MNTIDVCIRDDFEDGSGTAIETYHFTVEDADEFLADFHDYTENLEGNFGGILTSGEAKWDWETSELINDILRAGTAKEEKYLELYVDMAMRSYGREQIDAMLDKLYQRANLLKECADVFSRKMNQS